MHRFIRPAALLAVLVPAAVTITSCGNSTSTPVSVALSTVPADAGGGLASTPNPETLSGTVPASPASGSRAGTVYSITLKGEVTGDTVGITVFEPATLVAGQRYPLVLHSHGYAGSRQTSTSSGGTSSVLPATGNIDSLLAAGYGAISISERGSDESTGTIRVMDPDYEGHDLISVLDWAEHHLDWLLYGPSADGTDPHNLVVGSIGGSYGGMYQYLIHNIDPKRRLDAIVPQIAPFDLTYSLLPNNTIKAAWDSILFAAGSTAGQNLDRGHTDPYITNFFVKGLTTNQIASDGFDFFYYHSNAYFCGDRTVAGNGEINAMVGSAGMPLKPGYAPVRGPLVNAMLFQGMRDTLFTFNNAYANYQCLKGEGGDVRLLSYQAGHNSLQAVPDPGNYLYQPANNDLDGNCGNINPDTATVAFFDQYLKGIPGAANKAVPTQTCLSLTKGDAVLVDHVTTGTAGKAIDIPSTMVVAGGAPDVPVSVPLGITAGSSGDVLGGIPYVELDVEPVNAALPGEPIVFVGLGQTRNGVPGVYDLVDNQITPLRGSGLHQVDLVGIAERLAPGDTLALLIYGAHDQYHVTGSVNVSSPAVVPVTVTGKVWVPMLGNLPNIAASQ
jgi:ABC-2 type transport system ATP-binding protein